MVWQFDSAPAHNGFTTGRPFFVLATAEKIIPQCAHITLPYRTVDNCLFPVTVHGIAE